MPTPEELDLCNGFISKEPDYIDCFYIDFPHVLSDSNPLGNMDSWKEVVQPSRKPRCVGPRKPKPKRTTDKTKINQKNKKSRRVTIQISKKPRSVKMQTPELEEVRSGEDTLTPQCLVSVARHLKNLLYINSGASMHNLFN